MKLLRRISIFVIGIILIVSQNAPYVFANEDLTEADVTLVVESVDGNTSTLELTSSGSVDEWIVQFPAGATFDAEATRALNVRETEGKFDQETSELTIANEGDTFRFVAGDLPEGDSKFRVAAYYAGQEVAFDETILTVAVIPETNTAEEADVMEESALEENEEQPAAEDAVIEEESAVESPAEDSSESADTATEQPAAEEESAELIPEKEPVEEPAVTLQEETANAEQETDVAPAPVNPEGNLEVYYGALQSQVLSGRTSTYQLDFKVTGSQSAYEDIELVVQLPTNPDTNVLYPQIVSGQPDATLTIAGVQPVYDPVNQTLTYVFPELASGQSYRTLVKATPELGTTPVSGLSANQRDLTSQVSLSGGSVTSVTKTADGVAIVSDGTVNLSKTYIGTEQLVGGVFVPKDGAPRQGEYIHWTLTASSSKQTAGQSYLKEGAKIIIRDVIPVGTSFVESAQKPGFTGVYNSATRTVTWEIDAPTIEQQKLATNTLFTEELSVVLRVNDNTANFSSLVNNADVEIELVGSTPQNPITRTRSATSTVIMAGPGVETPGVIGNNYYGYHSGAKDGVGRWETLPELGTSFPTVTDSANLTFMNTMAIAPFGLRYSVNGGAFTTDNYNTAFVDQIIASGYRHYTMEYSIDPKLDLTSLSITKPVIYYTNTAPLRQMETLPDTFVQLRVNGVWQAEYPVDFPNTTTWNSQPYIDVSNFGKQPGDVVDSYRVIYRNSHGGLFGRVFSTYDVVPGATGVASNSATYRYELNDGTRVVLQPTGDTSVHGPRYVNIVDAIETEPTVRTSIDFVDENNQPLTNDSTIERGLNRIKVDFLNLQASEDNVDGPVELVALLPPGVVLADDPDVIYSDNSITPSYEVLGEIDGRQRIKFTWDNSRLIRGENITASFNVDVTRTALSDINLEVYAFTDNTSLKRADGTKDFDDLDFNDNGNSIETMIGASSDYVIRKADDLQIKKEVKGALDADYSMFGRTTPGGEVNYRFNLTNTTGEIIEKFSFLDVLPSVGDLGITDNVPRDSQFDVTLAGPISFSGTLWEDRVTVLYSSAKNPSRTDLYAAVDYPSGSSPPADPSGAETPTWLTEAEVTDWSAIHSFKIVMNEGVTWLEGQNIVFEISARVPDLPVDRELLDPERNAYERAAWNSFAVTTNGLLAVEPLRVGVVMEYDIEDPVVEKAVDGQTDTLDLADRDQVFTWEVDYLFGNFTGGWDSVVLRDEIHELLEILAVRILDEAGNDISDTGTLTVTDNLVTFVPDKVDDSYSYLSGSVYTLEIDTSIRADVTNEELLPFIQGNGIPNQAELIIDDEPTQSNEVNVKPPGYAGLDVTKVDEETGEVLAGATFELRACASADTPAEDCTLVDTKTTDASGIISFRDLPLGEYILIETEAPDGYRLLTAPVRITLADADAGKIVERTVENSKNGWELPATGGIGTWLFSLIGLVLMAGSTLYAVRRKKG
ncbi:SpaA isopeptide-forming pilin-related protein [Jeotgalibacillus haloalkalitolerans]|uniref:SpaA isopeptide-forming pilin-related protein n=1 Tax=Jeotgalibacillus haloalkalitolerans TaxID=3104292 RepID=A0ABU5KKX2_9BACL|nr:SpaA isopeptide-forming pilin-related protein [Jeotgalibacillus sp. HH7-29]MDZ5711360.1 SpaA isopeptide-forming pilin-related protein [Jeotgalibacillus sp. HH7-29]